MDLDGSVFWYVGIALTLAALVVSYVGLRGKSSFPGSTRAFAAVAVPFALLVVVTAAYAVANAREEKDHREEELAHEEAAAAEGEQEASPGGSPSGEPAEETPAAPGGGEEPVGDDAPSETLEVSSPEDGGLSFEPAGLQASAGLITLAYENPSPVVHNVNLEDEQGATLAESEDVTDGSVEIDAELAPGEYLFYCSISGHREGGMEGTLTVE